MPSIFTAPQDVAVTEVSALTLKRLVKKLSEDFIPRTCELPKQLENAASYLFDEFRGWNPMTYQQEFEIGNQSFSNIISEFGPETDEVLVVGAHYDTFLSLPGADDNASGVAGLLELARMLSDTVLETRVILIAYACEEPPYFGTTNMGSFVHAKSMKGKTVKLMISLEMIGFFSSTSNSQLFPIQLLSFLYPTTGDYVAVIGQLFSVEAAKLKNTINATTEITAYSINAPVSVQGVDFSDHRNYWEFSYPAVMVTDTAFYRNRYYHTSKDTFDRLDYAKMSEIVEGVYHHVLKLSN